MAKKSKGEHYVNNKEFLKAMVEWRERCVAAEDAGKPRPPITNYIGECFLKIATHLSYRPNFINYTYRDEMISDGIENCLQYVKNFNPTTMDGDDTAYSVQGFDPNVMLPDEDVYKPKKKSTDKSKGLEPFMESDIEDSNNN